MTTHTFDPPPSAQSTRAGREQPFDMMEFAGYDSGDGTKD